MSKKIKFASSIRLARLILTVGLVCISSVITAREPVDGAFFQRRDGVSVYFDLEIANTPAERKHGLMWRKFLAPRQGMLFDFESSSRIRMWMKNTPVSLDMIFVDEGKRIVHIHQNAEPFNLEIIQTPVEARYTVEINAGEVQRYHLAIGDRMYFR